MNQRVIKPGSIGLNAKNPAQEFLVESIFYSPSGLQYRGKLKLDIGLEENESWSTTVSVPIADVLMIDSSNTGRYNYSTGKIE